MQEGYDPHKLDVATMAKKAWEIVSQVTCSRFWIKPDILSAGQEAEINSSEGRACYGSTKFWKRLWNRKAPSNSNMAK